MIKTAVKLLIVLAVLNAAARAGMIAWQYYQLKDEAQQIILFGSRRTTGELREQILAKAVELSVPLEPQNIEVRRDGSQTFADVFYIQPLEYFPNFEYPLDLSFSVATFALNTPRADELTP